MKIKGVGQWGVMKITGVGQWGSCENNRSRAVGEL